VPVPVKDNQEFSDDDGLISDCQKDSQIHGKHRRSVPAFGSSGHSLKARGFSETRLGESFFTLKKKPSDATSAQVSMTFNPIQARSSARD
jgi:hypothetical protein